jgi:hypothetical protein
MSHCSWCLGPPVSTHVKQTREERVATLLVVPTGLPLLVTITTAHRVQAAAPFLTLLRSNPEP